MGSYKDNFEEQHERRKYRKSEYLFSILLAGLLSWTALSLFLMPDSDSFFYIINADISNSGTYWTVGGILLILVRWWWNGTPFMLTRLLPFIISYLPDTLRNGKREELEVFFYQGLISTDGVKRAKEYKYLTSSAYSITNMFDFDPVVGRRDNEKTNRIVALFRDKKKEKILKLIESRNASVSKKAKRALVVYENRYAKKTTPDQNFIYDDLWRAIEGILQEYEVVIDEEVVSKLEIADLPSPVNLRYSSKKKMTLLDSVDETIDVFKDGKVLFSMRMIAETVEKVSLLFSNRVIRDMERGSEMQHRYNKFMSDKDAYIEKVTDYFMFVFFRRLLLNYGAMPSGWFVGRIEDYDIRAIISAVDRELIPTITSQNDGSNDIYGDDSFAAMFLFLYWDFMKSDVVQNMVEAIDWCFNTTKDVNEMKMREFSRNAKKEDKLLQDGDEIWAEMEKL